MRPPYETFKRPVCRGSLFFKNACGHCEKCDWERATGNHANSLPEDAATEEAPSNAKCQSPQGGILGSQSNRPWPSRLTITAALCRNGRVITTQPAIAGERWIRIPHLVPTSPPGLLAGAPAPNLLEGEVQMFAEVFERNADWGPCPCCGAVVFNSINYLQAPPELQAVFVKGVQ